MINPQRQTNQRRSVGHSNGHLPYMAWQNLIEEECEVQCTVKVELKAISIRAESYADYCLAASIVRKRTSLEVVRG